MLLHRHLWAIAICATTNRVALAVARTTCATAAGGGRASADSVAAALAVKAHDCPAGMAPLGMPALAFVVSARTRAWRALGSSSPSDTLAAVSMPVSMTLHAVPAATTPACASRTVLSAHAEAAAAASPPVDSTRRWLQKRAPMICALLTAAPVDAF